METDWCNKKRLKLSQNSHIQQMYPLFDIISMMLYDVCEFKRKTGKPIRNEPINSSAILTFKQKQMFQWRQTVWCGRVKPPPNLESSLNLKPSMISHSLFLLWNIYKYHLWSLSLHWVFVSCLQGLRRSCRAWRKCRGPAKCEVVEMYFTNTQSNIS